MLSQLKDYLLREYKNCDDLKSYVREHINDEIFRLIKLEHRRWNYRMAFFGYDRFDNDRNINIDIEKEVKHKNNCLTTFDKLVDNKPDILVYYLIPYLFLFIKQ